MLKISLAISFCIVSVCNATEHFDSLDTTNQGSKIQQSFNKSISPEQTVNIDEIHNRFLEILKITNDILQKINANKENLQDEYKQRFDNVYNIIKDIDYFASNITNKESAFYNDMFDRTIESYAQLIQILQSLNNPLEN